MQNETNLYSYNEGTDHVNNGLRPETTTNSANEPLKIRQKWITVICRNADQVYTFTTHNETAQIYVNNTFLVGPSGLYLLPPCLLTWGTSTWKTG